MVGKRDRLGTSTRAIHWSRPTERLIRDYSVGSRPL
jgi:hypothetical protein